MKKFAETSSLNKIEINDTKIGIITSGITYQYAKEAMPHASYLKLGMVNPINENLVKDFAKKVDRVVVLEELDPFIEEFCKAHGVNAEEKKFSHFRANTPRQ